MWVTEPAMEIDMNYILSPCGPFFFNNNMKTLRCLLSLHRHARRYTVNNNNIEEPAPHNKPGPPPRNTPSPQPQVRHEAHEGTTVLNVPYNPPGGGPGGSIPGGGAFSFTNSPILDAMLTTAIGLGAGKRICLTHLTTLAQHKVH